MSRRMGVRETINGEGLAVTDSTTTFTKRQYSRRNMLALAAAGAATAALAACGDTAVPTTTPAPTVAAAAGATKAATTPAGPAPTATLVPQTFGNATVAPTVAAAAAAASPSAASSTTTGAVAPTAAASTAAPAASAGAMKPANLADKQVFRYAESVFPDGLDPAVITSPYITPSLFEGTININIMGRNKWAKRQEPVTRHLVQHTPFVGNTVGHYDIEGGNTISCNNEKRIA